MTLAKDKKVFDVKEKLDLIKAESVKRAKLIDPKVPNSTLELKISRATPWASTCSELFEKYPPH